MNRFLVPALLAVTLPATAAFAETGADRVDVAYEQLSQGRTAEAIAKLDNSRAVKVEDPSALINLGTAYARQGRTDDARAMFVAARNSDAPYYLELADGRWVDSRKAANMALANLEKRTGLALR